MTPTNERLADEAERELIAEAERLAQIGFDERDDIAKSHARDTAANALRLFREGWQPPEPEPDEATQLFNTWFQTTSIDTDFAHEDKLALIASIRQALSEAEARGRAVVVPDNIRDALEYLQDFAHGTKHRLVADYFLSPSTPATPKPESPNVKPDRYLKIWQEAEKASLYARELNHNSDQAAAAVLKREIEALRGVSPIPKAVVDLVEEHERIFERQRLRQNIGDGSNWHKTYVAPAIEALREGDVR